MTNMEILQMDPMDLEIYLFKTYKQELPPAINSVEDLARAQAMLSKLTNTYSYLTHLATMAKIMVRTAKKEHKADKDMCNSAVDRRDAISEFREAIKLDISTLSRMITIKQEINKELNMSNSIDSIFGKAV